jgi:hypothetical protein
MIPLKSSKIILFLSIFAFLLHSNLDAQMFKPFTSFRVIETDHFEIIYPPESEATAVILAGFADSAYDRVSGLLKVEVNKKIPVTITPHTDKFNSFMSQFPYIHIMIFDTPLDPDLFSYTNSLENLFIHELTHAMSLSSMAPAYRGLRKVFGGWVMPSLLYMPKYMSEGISVSFESLDGTGRSHDPLVRSKLIQAAYEDTFLTPHQASGVYDLPPAGAAFYDYGGLFSTWLQEQYGMDKYIELWQNLGWEYHSSFFFYNNGFYNIFRKVYGRSADNMWDEFKNTLKIEGIEDSREGVIFNGSFLSRRAVIDGISAGGGKVFAVDQVSGKVISYDPSLEKSTGIMSTAVDSTVYDIAASADGDKLLVSSYRVLGRASGIPRAETVVSEYDTSGRKTGRDWLHLYNGEYFRDGVIGLKSDRHTNTIVFISGAGEEEVLLRGNAELLYSGPAALDDSWIAFIAAKKGRRELCLYNYDTRELYTLGSGSEDDERWAYIRGLQVSGGRISFGYARNGELYKLGSVDASAFLRGNSDELEVVFSERELSGGVFEPVFLGDTIYYRGAFATWDALMAFPEKADSLSGRRVPLSLQAWETEDLAAAGILPLPIPEYTIVSKPYNPIKYLNPFQFWFPLPLVHYVPQNAFPISFDGVGLISYLSDPTENNAISGVAYMDIRNLMGAFNLQWTNLSLGLPINFQFIDTISSLVVEDEDADEDAETEWAEYRETDLSLSTSFIYSLGREDLLFALIPEFGLTLRFAKPQDSGDFVSAYTWPLESAKYYVGLGVQILGLQRFSWERFGHGASLGAFGMYYIAQGFPRVEGLFRAAFEPIPLGLNLYGVWDQNGMNLGGTGADFSPISFGDFASTEYTESTAQELLWLAGGEVDLKLFSLEIQRSLSELYFNRLFGVLAYRGAFFNDGGSAMEGNELGGGYRLAQSLILRLGSTISNASLPSVPFKMSLFIWGAWKISNMYDGTQLSDFSIGPSFTLGY